MGDEQLFANNNCKSQFNMMLSLIVIGVMVCGIITGFIVFGNLLYDSLDSNNWPTADGKIVASKVNYVSCGDDPIRSCRSDIITYSYTVDGRQFTSNRIHFIGSGGEKVDKYPAGTNVVVYYDPQNPASAVLKRGLTFYVFAIPIVFVGFFGVFTVAILLMLNRRGKGSE
jgi:hypothetical protein